MMVQLGIYDDRVEICDPGRFPVGVTPENIKTLHSSKPRNLHIAQVMYKASYLEGWGTGITRMIDVCKAHNLPEPLYQIWADGTIVLTFQRPKTAISNNPRIKYEELENTLNLGETTIRRAVKWMKENGYINPTHSKIKGVWQILD